MKIRIYDNSIRLRLDRQEVEAIGAAKTVLGRTDFPGDVVFEYALSVSDRGDVTARFSERRIEVVLPEGWANHWAGDDSEVSIRAAVGTTSGSLGVLVEKDFECLEPRSGEDQSNRFKNPKAMA